MSAVHTDAVTVACIQSRAKADELQCPIVNVRSALRVPWWCQCGVSAVQADELQCPIVNVRIVVLVQVPYGGLSVASVRVLGLQLPAHEAHS